MGVDTFVAYCGLRFEIAPEEIADVELRTDARVLAAKKSGINYYYGSFGDDPKEYLLFVGFPIGIFGVENCLEARYFLVEMQKLFNKTQAKLDEAGFEGEAEFYFKLEPDI